MQYRHFYAIKAYNEIEMTFDTLLEQKFKAELGVVLVTGTKSSLELKYGPLRDRKNRLQRYSLQEWKPFVPFYDGKKQHPIL